jgi:hypothetical protein
MSEPQDFRMSTRKGEAITDTEEWDNEIIPALVFTMLPENQYLYARV